DHVFCNGEFHLGNRTFGDWKEGGHGTVNLHHAIVESCNVYFYEAALRIGMDTIARYARAFGFGTSTGIDLPGEKPGFIPASRRGRHPTFLGDTVNMAIGQGAVLATPMQVGRMMAAVANGGIFFKPRLVQRVVRADGHVLYSDPGRVNGHVELSPMVWAFLRQSLLDVVNEGTGVAAHIPGIEIAGKTGTAQLVANSRADRGQDNAWFAAFAPANDPQYVVVVMIERGGKGGEVAAPIAVASLDYRNLVRAAPAFYAAGLLALLAVFVMGRSVSGARRWIPVGPLTVQPSELFKFAFVLMVVWVLTWRWAQPVGKATLGLAAAVLAPPFVLIVKQPDLGTALVLLPVLVLLLVGAGIRLRLLGGVAVAGLSAMPVIWFALKDDQRDRLLVYLDPFRDPLGTAYNVIQAKIAIGSGQFLGKGIAGATQSRLAFLPERHT